MSSLKSHYFSDNIPSTPSSFFFFFFNDTATTEIYTLSLHDALPISRPRLRFLGRSTTWTCSPNMARSEEHTSELQSRLHLVCRLLLEKKKKTGLSMDCARQAEEA